MLVDDVAMIGMVMVGIDDHLIEPPDLFLRPMPQRDRDQAPELVDDVATVGGAADTGDSEYGIGVDRARREQRQAALA